MRVGFIGDVHGDLRALSWALDALADVDRVICLGDVVDGPRDEDCINLLRARGVLVLQGNHDYECASFGGVGPEYLGWLASLPRQELGDRWHAWHSDHHDFNRYFSWDYIYHDRDVRRMLRQTERQVVLCGHTHVPAVHVLDGATLSRISKEELQDGPLITLYDGCRYSVNIGRPTQCVVVLDEAAASLEYRFHPTPRFERRFGESA